MVRSHPNLIIKGVLLGNDVIPRNTIRLTRGHPLFRFAYQFLLLTKHGGRCSENEMIKVSACSAVHAIIDYELCNTSCMHNVIVLRNIPFPGYHNNNNARSGGFSIYPSYLITLYVSSYPVS